MDETYIGNAKGSRTESESRKWSRLYFPPVVWLGFGTSV